jgi:Peptidase inhibitor family I36
MRTSLIAGLIITSGIVLAPVVADAGSASCPASKICLYADNNFKAFMGFRSAGQGISNISVNNEDALDSWENKSSTNAAWYKNLDGKGTCRTMLAKKEDNNISFLDSDTASSWKTDGACVVPVK